jgi:DNA-binding MarR family transcriptional regulator
MTVCHNNISHPNYQSAYLSVFLATIDDVTVTDQAPGRFRDEPAERMAGYTGYLARLAAQRAAAGVQAVLPPGRTPRDLAILCVLAEGPVSQASLGNLLEVNRTVMISVIDELEAAGLVRRQRDQEDRRRYALRITEAGVGALERMRESVGRADRAFTAAAGEAGARRLTRLLALIVPELSGAVPESLAAGSWFLIDHATGRLRRHRELAMRAIGLEPRCVGMLVALDSAQPCTQERLAERMGVTGPTIVPAVDELHSAGLIHRDRNPADRRAHVLRLTPGGEEYLGAALTAEDSAQRDLAAALGPAETAELNALLMTVLPG